MNNYYSATLGRVLKDWHERQNLTMYAIAKTLKAHRQPLDDLEAGKSSAPENALRYLVWVSKRDPQIWQTYLNALSNADTEEEQLRILVYQEQEQKNKDRAEAARKAKEAEAARLAVRDDVKAEIMAEIGKTIEDAKLSVQESQQTAAAASQLAAEANKRVGELESAMAEANKTVKSLTANNESQEQLINQLRAENNKLREQAAQMRKAPLWRRIFGKY